MSATCSDCWSFFRRAEGGKIIALPIMLCPLHAQTKAMVEVIAAQKQLLVAYRLGDHARADRALTRLEQAEQALATMRSGKE